MLRLTSPHRAAIRQFCRHRSGTCSTHVSSVSSTAAAVEGGDVAKADGAVWELLCSGVKASMVSPEEIVGGASSLAKLSSALSLPATPAFTSAVRYMCHVSTALWQEVGGAVHVPRIHRTVAGGAVPSQLTMARFFGGPPSDYKQEDGHV
uniref:Hypothetical phosphoglycan beta 1,3 galactosyltransferase 1 n=1 Tax=Leishmania guyanensis TaxID=5670 RepID=A0A1E1IPN8_LEIGU